MYVSELCLVTRDYGTSSGVHEPAKERQTQHARPSRSSSPSHVQNFLPYTARLVLEAIT